MLDVAEDCHPDDCIDKSDESQQRADVEQRRQGDNQGEQQLPDTLGSLDIQPWSMTIRAVQCNELQFAEILLCTSSFRSQK